MTRAGAVGTAALLALCITRRAAAEVRPTEGGLWSFDQTDVLESWDVPGDAVRVHFSVDGPNVTRLEDDDDDGIPDYVQDVGLTAMDALVVYADNFGVQAPVSELEVGPELGGSPALDIYLVDFGGAADGRFGIDACTDDGRCAGFVVVENDFSGYGYPSILTGIRVVVSHELFHAVQAAYASLPVWISEGTATWATHRYDSMLPDFGNACGGYLADAGRPLYQPPLGPVPAFAYGSALWWEFITRRNGDDVVDTFLTAIADAPARAEPEWLIDDVLAETNDSLASAWPVFVQHNLATGFRAGGSETHPYAAELDPIDADAVGANLDIDARLFPLAAEYWRIDHPGGDLVAGVDAELQDCVVTLHPVADFAADGVVGDAIATEIFDVVGSVVMFEALPAGGYWLVATQAAVSPGPAKARICVGSGDHVAGCGIDPVADDATTTGGSDDTSDDTSDDETPQDTGGLESSGGHDTNTDTNTDTDTNSAATMDQDEGCSCRSGSTPSPTWWALGFVLAARRRRLRTCR